MTLINLDAKRVFNEGGDLLSHTVARAVPSTLISLTSVFGMGTGVTLSLKPPSLNTLLEYLRSICDRERKLCFKAIDILVSLG